ncbi:MAG: TlpA family protein disulfide reductase, partial [Beijerinckiaceae bacterium]
PCKKEMPALDALQAQLGSADFEVVAVNIDTRNAERAPQFLDDIGVKNLVRYTDNSVKIFDDLKAKGKAFGMPTTILIDGNGCELANLAGPAEWASADAIALVKAAVARP